jgi:CheY-like chemotaxis protein
MPRANSFVIVVAAPRDEISLLGQLFERIGIMENLRFLSDGEQLLNYLEGKGRYRNRTEHPAPDLLLLDLALPGRNGFAVLKWLGEHPSESAPRVIVLTTSENLRDVNEAYRLGATTFIMKPIDVDDFRNTISAMRQASATRSNWPAKS